VGEAGEHALLGRHGRRRAHLARRPIEGRQRRTRGQDEDDGDERGPDDDDRGSGASRNESQALPNHPANRSNAGRAVHRAAARRRCQSTKRLPILPVPSNGAARRGAAAARSFANNEKGRRNDTRQRALPTGTDPLAAPRQAILHREETAMGSSNRNLFINGEWVAARGGAEFPVYNPATGEVWTHVADASREDAAAAIAAAREAQPAWAALTHSARARIIARAGDILEARAKEIQEVIVDEGGSWIGKAMFETGYSAGVYRAAAAAAYQVNGEILPSDLNKLSLVTREPL